MPLSTRRHRTAAGFAATVAVLLALAGCAGSAPGSSGATDAPGGSSTGGSPAADGPLSDTEFQAARDAYDLKLAQCLRDAGFDVKDPAPGQGFTETGEEINAAASTCMAEIGDPPQSASRIDPTEALKTMLEWTDCLRGRGIEVEEPRLGQAFIQPADATDEDLAACIPPV